MTTSVAWEGWSLLSVTAGTSVGTWALGGLPQCPPALWLPPGKILPWAISPPEHHPCMAGPQGGQAGSQEDTEGTAFPPR